MPDAQPAAAVRRELTARTASTTAVLQVLARATSLAIVAGSTAVVTRSLGPVGYADWATILSLAAMVGFVLDPGITPVVVRRITQVTERAPAPSSLLRVRLALAVVAWLLVTIVGLALRGTDALVLGLALAGQLVPRAVVINVGTWMQAEHRLHRQTLLEVGTTALGLAALLAADAAGASAPVLALCGFLAPATLLAVLMERELSRLPSARGLHRGEERDLVVAVLREAAPLAGALVLVSVYTRLNVVFINAAEDDVGVATFLFAFQFVEQIIVLAAIVCGTLLPILTTRAGSHDLRVDALTQELGLATALLAAAGALALMALADPIVTVIGGGGYGAAVGDLTLLAPTCLAVFLNFFVAYLFVAVGRASRYFLYNLAGVVFALVANAGLTLTFGAAGAARVTWATEALVASLAAVPYFAASQGGRRLLAELAALAILVIGASELIDAGVLPRLPTLAVGEAVVLLAAVALLRRHRGRVGSGRSGAGLAGDAGPPDGQSAPAVQTLESREHARRPAEAGGDGSAPEA